MLAVDNQKPFLYRRLTRPYRYRPEGDASLDHAPTAPIHGNHS